MSYDKQLGMKLLPDELELPEVVKQRLRGLRKKNAAYKQYAGKCQILQQVREFEMQLNRELTRKARKLEQFAWDIAFDSDDMTREQIREYARKLRTGLGLDK